MVAVFDVVLEEVGFDETRELGAEDGTAEEPDETVMGEAGTEEGSPALEDSALVGGEPVVAGALFIGLAIAQEENKRQSENITGSALLGQHFFTVVSLPVDLRLKQISVILLYGFIGIVYWCYKKLFQEIEFWFF